MRVPWRSSRPKLSVATTVAIAAAVFVAAVAVMAAIAGWHEVVGQLRPRLSWWFALAFAAEAAAFAGYVFAYRSVAQIEHGVQIGLREATELVAVGFGAFLAKGGATLDNEALTHEGAS